MADNQSDPIANTAAFRAFNQEPVRDEPVARRPSPLVYVTAVIALVAIVIGVIAFAL